MALQASTPSRRTNGEARVPAPAGESDAAAAGEDTPQSVPVQGGDGEGDEHVAADTESGGSGESRSRGTAADRSARRQTAQEGSAASAAGQQSRKRQRAANRRPSGRER